MVDFTLGQIQPQVIRPEVLTPENFAQIGQQQAQTAQLQQQTKGLQQQQDVAQAKAQREQRAREIAAEEAPGGGVVGQNADLYTQRLYQEGLPDEAATIKAAQAEAAWKQRYDDYYSKTAETKSKAEQLAELVKKAQITGGAISPVESMFNDEWKDPTKLTSSNPNTSKFLQLYPGIFNQLKAMGHEDAVMTPAQAAQNPAMAMSMLSPLLGEASTYHDRATQMLAEQKQNWSQAKEASQISGTMAPMVQAAATGQPAPTPQAPLPATMTPEQLQNVQQQAGARYPTMGALPGQAVAANAPSPAQAFQAGYQVPGLQAPAPTPEPTMTEQKRHNIAMENRPVAGGIQGSLQPQEYTALNDAIASGRLDEKWVNSRTAKIFAQQELQHPDMPFNALSAAATYERSQSATNTQTLLNSVTPILDNLLDAGKALGNQKVQFVNSAINLYKEASGDPAITTFNNTRDQAVAEVERGLLGTGVLSDSKYNREIQNIKSAQSWQQLQAAVSATKATIKARLEAVKAGPNQARNAAGPVATKRFNPATGQIEDIPGAK